MPDQAERGKNRVDPVRGDGGLPRRKPERPLESELPIQRIQRSERIGLRAGSGQGVSEYCQLNLKQINQVVSRT